MQIETKTKITLLKLARQTIEKKLFGKSSIELEIKDPVLKQTAGAFVTLHKNGLLRGCIGNIIGIMPLEETISEMAIASAFKDPRFPSLSPKEYQEIEIEITILSPLTTATVNDVEIGKHGVVISRGHHKGLLLPQVATEYNMDRETFLSHTCLKAGLPKEAWKEEGTKIEIFTGIVFSEKELGLLKS